MTPQTQDTAQNNKKVIVEHQDLVSKTPKKLCSNCKEFADTLYNGFCLKCHLEQQNKAIADTQNAFFNALNTKSRGENK